MLLNEITQNEALALFENRDGSLYWKVSKGRTKAGNEAGNLTENGYKRFRTGGKTYLVHRIVFLMHHGYMPEFVDHIDGNKINNSIENLRAVSQSQNQWNSKLRTDNITGYKGVRWHKHAKKWTAKITMNKKTKHLGYFDDIELADLVVQMAREKYHGKYANNGVTE